eukprot:scaffold4031_cov101-Isochrysis_galbana.AAC.1
MLDTSTTSTPRRPRRGDTPYAGAPRLESPLRKERVHGNARAQLSARSGYSSEKDISNKKSKKNPRLHCLTALQGGGGGGGRLVAAVLLVRIHRLVAGLEDPLYELHGQGGRQAEHAYQAGPASHK